MKPFVPVLMAAVLTLPLPAQDSTQTTSDRSVSVATRPHRDPHLALVLGSLIPGAGHVYAGEYVKGFLNYETVVVTIGAGAMGVLVANMCSTRCNPVALVAGNALGVAAIGAGVWKWVSTARDAPHAAERSNVKHGRRASSLKPIITGPVGSHGDWRVGASVPW
jgi:hypothetical protein